MVVVRYTLPCLRVRVGEQRPQHGEEPARVPEAGEGGGARGGTVAEAGGDKLLCLFSWVIVCSMYIYV